MNDKSMKTDRTPPAMLCFADREQMGKWLNTLRDMTSDAFAAGDDATRPVRERVLSRAEAKRKLHEAQSSIERLLKIAENALEAA